MTAGDRDYLWDGAGAPDPDVAELEALLSPLRYDAPLDELRVRRASRAMRWRRIAPIAAAAVVLIGLGAALWWSRDDGAARQAVASCAPVAGSSELDGAWKVTSLAGAPRCGGQPMAASARLPLDTWLETDHASQVEVAVADIGTVQLRERSRLRVLASAPEEHRLELTRGQIHASIAAPPRIFLVETPSAVAVDLGCEYTLTVDDDGGGLLAVSFGYVALVRDGRESFVPMGAQCEIRPGIGPGTPYADAATAELRAALAEFDFAEGGRAALDRILALAGSGDTVSLWNLLTRVTGEDRARVYERLAGFVPPPERATRERILRGDETALLWWRMTLEEQWMPEEEWPDEDEESVP